MAKKILCGLEKYDPTPEQVERMGRILLMAYNNKLIVKETEDGYLAYHSRCNKMRKIPKQVIGQVRKAHICPFCFSPITSVTTNTKDTHSDFVKIESNDHEIFGYYVMYDFELGKPLWVDIEQTYYACGNEAYYRYMGLDMFAHYITLRSDRNDWRYRPRYRGNPCSGTYYYGYEYDTYADKMWTLGYSEEKLVNECLENKRKYLENVASYIEKSNQRKLVIDNLFNEDQMRFIKAFDLKTPDEVYRNNAYIKKNSSHIIDLFRYNITLNVFYLDYLRKNKIDLGNYFKYLNDLKELGFKYDKPTDFEDRKQRVEEMVKQARDKQLDEKCIKRYESLPKYSKDDISIQPFKSAEEIRRCGKELHNCIGGYVRKYAEGNANLFHLDLKGKMKVAIEIRDLKLAQAMVDHDKKCKSGKYFNAIKSFCEENGFSLEKFV